MTNQGAMGLPTMESKMMNIDSLIHAGAKVSAPVSVPGRQPNSRFRRGGRGLRLKPGERNKSEAEYESQVLEPAKRAGDIIDFWFQDFTFKLAADCRYTPDFVVLANDGVMEVHEIKGTQKIKKAGTDPKAKLGSKAFVEDDAKVKIKVFANKFPFRCFAVFKKRAYEGGGWGRTEYTAWSEIDHGGDQSSADSAQQLF